MARIFKLKFTHFVFFPFKKNAHELSRKKSPQISLIITGFFHHSSFIIHHSSFYIKKDRGHSEKIKIFALEIIPLWVYY